MSFKKVLKMHSPLLNDYIFRDLKHVVLGTHDLNSNHEKIEIEKNITYKDYKDVGHGDDIMLLKVSAYL